MPRLAKASKTGMTMSAPVERTAEQIVAQTETPAAPVTPTEQQTAPPPAPTPAEPDQPITPERVKHIAQEGMVPVSVVKALRDRLREAEGRQKPQETPAAPTAATKPAPPTPEYEGDEDAFQAAIDRALTPHLQRIAQLEARDSARERQALEAEYAEMRSDALDALRTRLTAARDEFLPGLKPKAQKLADRAMWGTVQEIIQERAARGEDPEEVFFELASDVNARAGVIARASQEAREALAELGEPQVLKDKEAQLTAPLTSSSGVAAELQAGEPETIHDPKFMDYIRNAIARIGGGAAAGR
jgi:hypothetical protein